MADDELVEKVAAALYIAFYNIDPAVLTEVVEHLRSTSGHRWHHAAATAITAVREHIAADIEAADQAIRIALANTSTATIYGQAMMSAAAIARGDEDDV